MKTNTALLVVSLLAATTLANVIDNEETSRLLGGSDASNNEPYVAFIQTHDVNGDNLNICGGAIINGTIVVTTAFCVYGALTATVRAGSNDLTSADVQEVKSQMIIIHPEFSKNTMENDIALIKVTPPFDLRTNVKTIRLASTKASTKDALAGKLITLFGWGDVQDGFSLSTPIKMQTLDLPVGLIKACTADLKTVYYALPSTAFCTNTTFLSKSICSNDWGSPAVARIGKETTYSLVGLASKYVQCPRSQLTPDLFTQVGVLNKWIQNDGGALGVAK